MNVKTVGIAGGGQLGRMLAQAAKRLGFKVAVLDPTKGSPAAQVADTHILGSYTDALKMEELAAISDVLTYEIESVNADALEKLSEELAVHPTPATLSIIKDKLLQKRFLRSRGIPVAPFAPENEATSLGYPYILKARRGGFDGRGNALLEKESDIKKARSKLKGADVYAEGYVRFEKELAVVAARTPQGDIKIFPLVETIHKDHICHMVLCPASVSEEVERAAFDIARKVLESFEGAGIFAIELFLSSGKILVNEIAPRVHNSGHLTIEGNYTSQFEQHIRAIAGLPLGDPGMKVPAAVMINILGDRDGKARPNGVEAAQKLNGVSVHIYGKMDVKPARKMGHITAVGKNLEDAKQKALKAHKLISI